MLTLQTICGVALVCKLKTESNRLQFCRISSPVFRFVIELDQLLGSLRNHDGDSRANGTKQTMLMHVRFTFWYISLPFLQNINVKS